MGVGEGYNPACTTVSLSVGLWLCVSKGRLHFRYFHDPKPSHRLVMDAISDLVSEVARSLRCGVNRLCSYSLVFRSFFFLVEREVCPHRLGKYFDLKILV